MDTEGIASVSKITFARVDVLLDFYAFFFFFFYQDARVTLVATTQGVLCMHWEYIWMTVFIFVGALCGPEGQNTTRFQKTQQHFTNNF